MSIGKKFGKSEEQFPKKTCRSSVGQPLAVCRPTDFGWSYLSANSWPTVGGGELFFTITKSSVTSQLSKSIECESQPPNCFSKTLLGFYCKYKTIFGEFYQVFFWRKTRFFPLAIYELIDSEYASESECEICSRILLVLITVKTLLSRKYFDNFGLKRKKMKNKNCDVFLSQL